MFKLLRMNNYYFIVGGSAAWAEGHYADMAEQVQIIRYLVRASKIKKIDSII